MFFLQLALALLAPIQDKKGAPPAQPNARTTQAKQVSIRPEHRAEARRVESKSLTRFDRPIDRPRYGRPADVRGLSWRWHPSYGWIGFNEGFLIPAGEILPATFALPAQVTYYDVQATESVVCPHCGASFQVIVR